MKKEIVSGVKALLAGMLVASMLGRGQEAASGDASNPSESTEPVSSSEEEASKEKNNADYRIKPAKRSGATSMPFARENIAAFEEAHPNITIEVLLDPDEQITSILQTKLAAGQLSDIVVYNKVSKWRMSWIGQ